MNSNIKTLTAAVALACVAGAANADVKIGVSHPLSGPAGMFGTSAVEATKLAVAQINAAGGVKLANGKTEKLELVIVDDESSPAKGPVLAQKLISDGVVAVVGYSNTGVFLPSLSVYNNAKIPLIINVSTGSTIPTGPDSYIYRVAGFDGAQTEAIINAVSGEAKVAFIGDSTAYGDGARAIVEKSLAAKGKSLCANEKLALKDVDMTSQAMKVKAACGAGGDVGVIVYTLSPEVSATLSALKKVGYTNANTISGSWTFAADVVTTNPAARAFGPTFPVTMVETGLTTPLQKQFHAAYLAQTKAEKIAVPSAAAQAYDSVLILKAALEQAKSLSGPDIKAALEGLKKPVQGVIKEYKSPYSNDKREALSANDLKMVRINENGTLVPVVK